MNNVLISITSTSAITSVVALLIIIISSALGLKNGFVKTFLKTFGVIFSLFLAVLLCSKGAEFLQNTFGLAGTISDWLSGILEKVFGSELMNTTLESATENSLKKAGIAGWIVDIIISTKAELSTGALPQSTRIIEVISPAFAYYIVMVISAILLYVIFRVFFFLLGETVKSLHKIKVVGITDGLFGLLLGLIKGVIFIQLFTMILGALPIEFIQTINSEISNSAVVSFINSINLFNPLLTVFGKSNVVDFVLSVIVKK